MEHKTYACRIFARNNCNDANNSSQYPAYITSICAPANKLDAHCTTANACYKLYAMYIIGKHFLSSSKWCNTRARMRSDRTIPTMRVVQHKREMNIYFGAVCIKAANPPTTYTHWIRTGAAPAACNKSSKMRLLEHKLMCASTHTQTPSRWKMRSNQISSIKCANFGLNRVRCSTWSMPCLSIHTNQFPCGECRSCTNT